MTIFLTALKRILKQPVNWALLMLFPIVLAILIPISVNGADDLNSTSDMNLFFGIVDQDQTVLSKALAKQMALRYNNVELAEEDISTKLTEQDVPWVLVIRKGYERDLLAGREPVLEGYSLTVSDVSSLGSVTAANITRSLLLLGTNDKQAISQWGKAARVDVTTLETGDNWGEIAFWFGFFGFISMFTALFIVKALNEDKRSGMPDRIGVLPVTPRRYLIERTLAAFTSTELTAGLLLLVVWLQLGAIPHAVHLFGLLSLYNLFSVAMVLAVVSITKAQSTATIVMTMVSTVFAMLGGLFWPLTFVPAFMQKLAWFSPGYWLSRGLNHIQEITFEGYYMPLLFLLGFTVVALLLGGLKQVQALEE